MEVTTLCIVFPESDVRRVIFIPNKIGYRILATHLKNAM